MSLPFEFPSIYSLGTDITVVGWGAQIQVLKKTMKIAQENGFSCELIDLRTLLPWDKQTVIDSVKKTGRLLVSHEAPRTCGLGAEIAQTIQEECFTYLEVIFFLFLTHPLTLLILKAPIKRVTGYDTPFPLVFEQLYNPDEWKNFAAIRDTIRYDFHRE